MYTESNTLHKICSLDNTALTNTGDKYAWLPKFAWTCVGVVVNPTTAIGACTTPAVVTIKLTPSGGSLTSKNAVTVTASTAVGTELKGVAVTTGSDVFDVLVGGTITVNVSTAMSGGTTTGAADVYLILKEKP